jgi:hypothetical protein
VVPRIFRFIIRFVTPVFILVVFVGALIQPTGRTWGAAFRSLFAGKGWPFAPESVLGRIFHLGDARYDWFDTVGHPTAALVQDATRALLLVVFLACTALVWKAWRKGGRPER